MTGLTKAGAPVLDEGSLDEVGACLAAIRAMSTHNGAIVEEDARAIYSLSCIALAEWRKLDVADDKVPLR